MALYGWEAVAEQLSAHAARGEWDRMPVLLTDEMLSEFCLFAHEADLPRKLSARYGGIASRLSLYQPFVPGERDDSWKRLRAAIT
jgi:hypothetical protein